MAWLGDAARREAEGAMNFSVATESCIGTAAAPLPLMPKACLRHDVGRG